MNFDFSEEQNLLRDQAQGYLREHCPLEKVRKVLDGETNYAADVWQGVCDLGWTATTIPEEYGGIGLGYLELCVIAEELGRSLAPIPFSSSVYLATEAILQFGSDAQKAKYLPQLAAGEMIGCLAVAEGAGLIKQETLATQFADGKLSGTKLPVADASIANIAIVLAKQGNGADLCIVDLSNSSVSCEVIETIDPTRTHSQVTFDGTPAELLATTNNGWQALDDIYDRAAVLFAFEQIGGAQASLDMAKEYAMQRFAFGRPIASFQAIKHKLADMYIAATLAHSNAYYGAWALSTQAAELPVAAATARVSATQAFHECSKENIQTHGGMGFTWEFNCHMYYRRAKLLSLNLGSLPRWQNRLINNIEQSNQRAAS